MPKNVKHNNYRIDTKSNIAVFGLRSSNGNVRDEFVIDLDDVDCISNRTWCLTSSRGTSVQATDGTYLLNQIEQKYCYADDGRDLCITRLNCKENNFCKTNLVIASNKNKRAFSLHANGRYKRNNNELYRHFRSYMASGSEIYVAKLDFKLTSVQNANVSKSFSDSKYTHAKERAIYAAYLFEKQFYGDNFPEEEYARKEKAFKVLDKAERAEVEAAIVEQLEKLRLARKKIDNYYQSQTLAAKLASGEVIVRPDWKIGNVEKSDDVVVEPEPEPEPEPKPQLEPELAAVDYTIKCSKHLLNSAHQKRNTDEFVHVNHAVLKSGSRWVSVGSLPKRNNIFNVTFTEGNYTDARAMAIYSAYLFEKLVYGNNFPKTEYNRKLEVIKTLSTKGIEFVNERVAGKLEKVYTVLKELTSEKSAKSDEPLSTYKIEKSTDELLKQIKQTPLKEDALETAATVDEPTEKYPDIFGNPEVQKAIAEMKQKPSLFQRIKNWFTN